MLSPPRERPIAVFFGAAAASWWALTMVESRKTSSKSASWASSAKTRCQTPRSDQCAKRCAAVPRADARRQILPRRAGASDPQDRLDEQAVVLGRDPPSVALPGSMPSMRACWSSRSIFRGIAVGAIVAACSSHEAMDLRLLFSRGFAGLSTSTSGRCPI